MKKFIKDWNLQFLLFILCLVLFILVAFIGNYIVKLACNVLVIISSILFLISGIYQLTKDQYLKGILSIVLFVVGVVLSTVFLVFIPTIQQLVHRETVEEFPLESKQQPIPSDLPISKPVALYTNGLPNKMYTEKIKSAPDLVVYTMDNGYDLKYDIWMEPAEKGIVYLQLFEVTTNHPLTNPYFIENTRIEVENTGQSVAKMNLSEFFSVPNSDFNYPLGVRFEAWYTPDSNPTPVKIAEKNYLFE